jgi:hypothetical protein
MESLVRDPIEIGRSRLAADSAGTTQSLKMGLPIVQS